MSHGTDTSETADWTGRLPQTKYLIASYPATVLVLLFLLPLCLLFLYSFYTNVSGGYLERTLTLANYLRLVREPLYVDRLVFTLRIAAMTTVLSLLLGYPLAYRLARTRSSRVRRTVLTIVVSSLWLTFIIRGYAWSVMLSSDGLIPVAAANVGLLAEPVSFVPGYWALVVSMVYVFLPFMVLTLYTSIKNVDLELLEASKNLGAGPLTTFRHVTLPLTKSGIVSGSLLVFVLSLGVYVLPRILGSPPQWTLAVIIGNQVTIESNVPFGAALSIVLMLVVVLLVAVTVRLTGVTTFGLNNGGEET
ncbi:ABC transporter permease [Natrinema marinum]|uniref:ABC transporter permease n=1 Tax=Natrinema marinum TaxID=2961598 RepID=UPI0020C92189|nr:ABC transporter permease [Natrinema marinum]